MIFTFVHGADIARSERTWNLRATAYQLTVSESPFLKVRSFPKVFAVWLKKLRVAEFSTLDVLHSLRSFFCVCNKKDQHCVRLILCGNNFASMTLTSVDHWIVSEWDSHKQRDIFVPSDEFLRFCSSSKNSFKFSLCLRFEFTINPGVCGWSIAHQRWSNLRNRTACPKAAFA